MADPSDVTQNFMCDMSLKLARDLRLVLTRRLGQPQGTEHSPGGSGVLRSAPTGPASGEPGGPCIYPTGRCSLEWPVLQKEVREPHCMAFSCGSRRAVAVTRWTARHIIPGLVKFAWDGSWSLPETRKRAVPPPPRPSGPCFKCCCFVPQAWVQGRAAWGRVAAWPRRNSGSRHSLRLLCGGPSRNQKLGGALSGPRDLRQQSPHLASGSGLSRAPRQRGAALLRAQGSICNSFREAWVSRRGTVTPGHAAGAGQASWQGVVLGHAGPAARRPEEARHERPRPAWEPCHLPTGDPDPRAAMPS